MNFDRHCIMRILRLCGAAAAMSIGAAAAQGLRYEAAGVSWYGPLPERVTGGNPLKSSAPVLLAVNVKMLRDSTIINFENRQIELRRVDDWGIPVWQYFYPELDDYIRSRAAFALSQQWFNAVSASKASGRESRRRGLALELALPEQYYNQAIPKWAQRILGKDPPKLSIHGYEEVEVALVNSYSESPEGADSDFHPQFKNNYSITVNGTVGKLISVNMSTTNEGTDFQWEDQLKNIKIEYKGEGNELEDDIIQEVRAGYTNFEIPRTRLSGYSESREGLFGLYTRSKWGPLMLTSVISHERGEALKETFRPSDAGSAENAQPFDETQFVENRFFFLDTIYRNAYNEDLAGGRQRAVPRVGADLQVWLSVDQTSAAALRRADIVNQVRSVRSYPNQILFRRLKEDEHYYVDRVKGYIRLADSITVRDAIDVIGIIMSMRNPDGTIASVANAVKGDTTVVGPARPTQGAAEAAQYDTMAALWILKDKEPDATQQGFDLMWRNVYRLNVQGDVQITVKRLPASGSDTAVRAPDGRLFSEVLGLTDKDGKRIADDRIYDLTNGYLIIPPYSAAPDGNQPFANPALGSGNMQSIIYRYRKEASEIRNRDSLIVKYQIAVKGKPRAGARQTTFNLGWGVIENSEKVTADGRPLVRNEDYTIYYESGDLELTSLGAQSANKIDVEYQRESLFNPENKVFMGVRGEMRLPGLGPKSFIGSSVLYQLVGSADKVPRLGSEPFNKLLLDVNTHLDFDPEWMTEAVNMIPLISTEAPSSVQIDVEAAHSRMNSSLEGNAYVDDFESSKQTYPLSSNHRAWNTASPPIDLLRDSNGSTTGLLVHPPAWSAYWFEPEELDARYRVKESDVVKDYIPRRGERERYESVLRWVVKPVGPGLEDRYANPWAGIMYCFLPGSTDRTDDRFLELVVKYEGPVGGAGKLHIDMGEVSEDICVSGGPPNGKWDDEDILGEGKNDPQYNTGLDLIRSDSSEYWVVPNGTKTGWDTLRFGDPRLPYPKDPGRDNFREYSYQQFADPQHANGLHGDYAGRSLGLLTSEDLNRDGFSRDERFFRFNVALDSLGASRFNDATANVNNANGWYMLRIPLESVMADTIVDSARVRWDKIKYVRLWWDGFKTADSVTLMLARMQFVGNQWEAKPIRRISGQDSIGRPIYRDTTKLKISVINTEEDTVYRGFFERGQLPREITIEKDRYNNPKREQSLRLTYYDLIPGEEAIARRRLQYQALDVSAYENLSVIVRSDHDYRTDSVYFVFRFGIDDSSYYEYRTLLGEGWNVDAAWNHPIRIDLRDIATRKLEALGPEGSFRARDTTFLWPINSSSAYAMRCGAGRIPSFSGIRMLAVGILRARAGTTAPLSGEIWVNELKANGLKSFAGSAAIASVATQWADLFSMGVSGRYRDGDFREMTQSSLSAGNSEIAADANTSLQLGKFTPVEWGVSIPLNVSASASKERPQLRPGSDIPLTGADREPDKLLDFIDDRQSESRHFEKFHTSYSLATRYNKARKSDNAAVNLLADRISLTDLSYKYRAVTEHKGEKENSGVDYLKVDTTHTVSSSVKYDLSPNNPPPWTAWKPFEKSKAQWLPAEIKRYELTYLPSTVNVDLFNTTYEKKYARDELLDTAGGARETRSLSMSHGLNLKYSPISPILDLSYDVSVDRDLDEIAMRANTVGMLLDQGVFSMDETFHSYGYIYGEKTRRQNMRLDLRPKFLDWLTHSANYSASFTSNQSRGVENKRDTTFLDLGVNSEFGFTGSLEFGALFRDMAQSARKNSTLRLGFESVEKTLQKINFERISFNYTATLNTKYLNMHDAVLNTRDISQWRYLGYQLGATRSFGNVFIGEIEDDRLGGMRYRANENDAYGYYKNDARDVKRTWGLSSSFKIPEPLSITFSKITFDRSISYRVTPNINDGDTTIQFPKAGVNLSTDILNTIKIVSDNLQSVTVSSNYTFTQDRIRKIRRDDKGAILSNDYSLSQSNEFRPLARVSGTHKKSGVSVSYEHGLKLKWTSASQGQTTEKENSDQATISYAFNKKPDQPDLKLLWWTIPLKGQLTLNGTFNHTHNVQEKSGSRSGAPDGIASDTRTFSLMPNVAYDFTENVRGTAKYEWTHSDNEVPERRKTGKHLFGLVVRITF